MDLARPVPLDMNSSGESGFAMIMTTIPGDRREVDGHAPESEVHILGNRLLALSDY